MAATSNKIGAQLAKVLAKTYAPDSLIEREFGRYDIAFKTDGLGRPVLLFLGQKNEQGLIVGDRFTRTIQVNDEGKLLKDFWDHKGRSSA